MEDNTKIKTLYVKTVYASLSYEYQHYRSISTNSFCVDYCPGEWASPVLSYSKLFFWSNPIFALGFYPPPVLTVPYRGIMHWWCEAEGVEEVHHLMKDPRDGLIEAYWGLYLTGRLYMVAPRFPYRYDTIPTGVMIAARIRLISPLTIDEIEEIKSYSVD